MSLRLAKEEDIPQILAIYGPYILNTTYSFEYTVPSLQEFTERYRRITEFFPWLVWEENGKVLGYAYGSFPFTREAYRWCAEISVYLAPEAQKKGIGRKLVETLEKFLKLQGFHKIYSIITDNNTNSVEFHKVLGYKEVARLPGCGYKLGQICGTIWMEKNLNLVNLYSKKPTSFENLVKNDSLHL